MITETREDTLARHLLAALAAIEVLQETVRAQDARICALEAARSIAYPPRIMRAVASPDAPKLDADELRKIIFDELPDEVKCPDCHQVVVKRSQPRCRKCAAERNRERKRNPAQRGRPPLLKRDPQLAERWKVLKFA